VGGVCLGDMQHKVDRAVGHWLRTAPERFRAVFRKRADAKLQSGRDDPAPLPASLPTSNLR
jgi:hypothetical protein